MASCAKIASQRISRRARWTASVIQMLETRRLLSAVPTDIALDPSAVAENQVSGTQVGTFTTTDDSASFTYSLVGGVGADDNALFSITDNVLSTAAVFDYETQNVFHIRVSSYDGDSTPFEKEFTITVTDVDDAPTDISLDNSTVAENQPAGTLVGNLTTSDVDSSDFTYSLVDGTGSADNALFQIVGGELQTAAELNYDAQTTYYIRVRSEQTNDSSLYTEKEFVISATEVDDRVDILINGTESADSISVDVNGVLTNQYNMDVNGEVTNYWIGEVLSLTILGNGGNDSITLGGGVQAATLNGGYGDDTLTSSDGDDYIRGEDGNDVITSRGGADTIFGNTGNDDIDAGSGADSILAGLGVDTVDGASGHDMIYTGDGTDWISAGQGNDYIEGRGKADTIYGGVGDDTIYGGAGSDQIFGDGGDDTIWVGVSTVFQDSVDGGNGTDLVSADSDDVISNCEGGLI